MHDTSGAMQASSRRRTRRLFGQFQMVVGDLPLSRALHLGGRFTFVLHFLKTLKTLNRGDHNASVLSTKCRNSFLSVAYPSTSVRQLSLIHRLFRDAIHPCSKTR